MARIVWSPNARKDLLRLREFVAQHSVESAARAVRAIREGLDTLKIAPEAGKAVGWLPEGYRELVIPFGKSGYVVLYRFQESRVVIQTLRHGRESGYMRD